MVTVFLCWANFSLPLIVQALTTEELFTLPDQTVYAEIKGLLTEKKWEVALDQLKKTPDGARSEPSKAMLLGELLFRVGKRVEGVQVLLSLARELEAGQKFAAGQSVRKKAAVFALQFREHESLQEYYDGILLIQEGKHKAAVDKFEKALKREGGDHLGLLVRRGQAYFLDGAPKKGHESMLQAAALGIPDSNLAIWTGKILSLLGKSQEAQVEIKKGIELNPHSQVGGVAWVELLVALQKKDEATAWIQQHLEKQPYHLQLLARGAELRLGKVRVDSKELWNIRKDLQLGMSRLAIYSGRSAFSWEGELGIDQREPDKVQQKIASLLEKVEPKLH